ncbi:hypothetical protein Tco_0566897 [Tanacetum coccineum]
MPQKEETFQVMIDVIKNSTYFKAFTTSADVPEIFIVEGEEFTELQNDDDILTFLLNLGYKGPLHKYTNIENVDYLMLIWEDFAYQIDHGKERRSRREDYQEYGLEIPDVMLNDTIKRSESYQMFIKYSTGQIPSKKSRGKGSQGKKTVDDSQETVDVSEESKPEPVKRKTASRRVVKKKVTLSADDNIIPDDPDAALELGKSMSLTEAEEAEAARKVHATHERIMTESDPESKKSGGRSSRGITIQDTLSALKHKPATSKPKLKGAQTLTPAEKEAADIMQALKESKKTSMRQPCTGGSSEGTGTIPGVPNESTVVSATSSEGTEQESEYSQEDKLDNEEKDDKEGDTDDEGDDHISDTQDTDDEDDETESDEDDIYKYKIRMLKRLKQQRMIPRKLNFLQQVPAYLYLQVLVTNFLNFLLILVGIKSLLEVIATKVCITAAKLNLLEDMDSESVYMVAASKVPMLKPGEFELWRVRIEQYIQLIDYALWEVIENGNTAPKITVVEGVEKVIPPTTAEDKA